MLPPPIVLKREREQWCQLSLYKNEFVVILEEKVVKVAPPPPVTVFNVSEISLC